MKKKKYKYEKCAEHKPETMATTECKECGEGLQDLNNMFAEALGLK